MPQGGTGFIELPGPEKPLGIELLANPTNGTEYVLETCDAGMYAVHFPKFILNNFSTILLAAGALVLIHGSVLHKSERNKSLNTRYVYTFHMIEGAPGAASWDERNWLQPTAEMPFSPLFAST